MAKITTGRDTLEVGDIVRIETGPDEGKLAMVYELYPDFEDETKKGVSLITEDHRDLGGWSFKEQGEYLEVVYRYGSNYQFSNVSQLLWDSRGGAFLKGFEAYHRLCEQAERDLNA